MTRSVKTILQRQWWPQYGRDGRRLRLKDRALHASPWTIPIICAERLSAPAARSSHTRTWGTHRQSVPVGAASVRCSRCQTSLLPCIEGSRGDRHAWFAAVMTRHATPVSVNISNSREALLVLPYYASASCGKVTTSCW